MDFVHHNSLGSNELRLLLPVSISRQTLSFRVSEVPRRSAPRYTAVSYTWGDDEASEVIYLNGRAFHVRPNLWSCLYYLSHAAKHSEWTHIWADAICINQTNDGERSSQVRLMDQTYQNAACVSVWLGLVPIPEHYDSILPAFSPIKTVESDGFDWSDSMADVANRPYWSRFWVIQEFLLGRHVQLYCSGNPIDWLEFQSILCREAGIDQFGPILGDGAASRMTGSYKALPLVMGRHPDKHPEMQQPLYDLIVTHHKSKCKERRDRIFALLGLISLDERGQLGRFFPNYTITEDHVLIITLAHLILTRTCGAELPITPDCEELFLGLGVESKSQRRRLLHRAKMFDYSSDASPKQLLHMLTLHDEMEQYFEVSLEDETDAGVSSEESFLISGRTRQFSRFKFGRFAIGAMTVLVIFAAARKLGFSR